jgi:hypothetical protein
MTCGCTGRRCCRAGWFFLDDLGRAYPDILRAAGEYFAPGGRFTVLHQSYFLIAQLAEGATRGRPR